MAGLAGGHLLVGGPLLPRHFLRYQHQPLGLLRAALLGEPEIVLQQRILGAVAAPDHARAAERAAGALGTLSAEVGVGHDVGWRQAGVVQQQVDAAELERAREPAGPDPKRDRARHGLPAGRPVAAVDLRLAGMVLELFGPVVTQRALLAVMKGDAPTIAAAQADLADHIATFDTALKKIAEAGVEAEAQKALSATLPVVAQYTQAAQAVIAGAAQGVAQAEAQMPTLDKAFAQLEDELEKLSGMIEEDGTRISEAAAASVAQSLWTIAVAVLVASVTKGRNLAAGVSYSEAADFTLPNLADGAYQVLVIPLLTEGKRRDHVDRVLLVDVPEELQIQRLMTRDGVSHEQAQASLNAQATRAERLAMADDILRNTGRPEDLRQDLAALHERCEAGQVEPGGEVLAQRVQHTHAQRGVVVEPGVGLAQLAEHLGREAVALGRTVDGNLKDRTMHGAIDLAFGVGRGVHGLMLEAEVAMACSQK